MKNRLGLISISLTVISYAVFLYFLIDGVTTGSNKGAPSSTWLYAAVFITFGLSITSFILSIVSFQKVKKFNLEGRWISVLSVILSSVLSLLFLFLTAVVIIIIVSNFLK